MGQNKALEEGLDFTPRYNENGLIPCITTDRKGKVLMMAWMNEQALKLTLETGEAHYWSRSRNELWHKGTTSGDIQKVLELRIDCDQDCLWLTVQNVKAACHTGRKTCFYRKVVKGKNSSITLEPAE